MTKNTIQIVERIEALKIEESSLLELRKNEVFQVLSNNGDIVLGNDLIFSRPNCLRSLEELKKIRVFNEFLPQIRLRKNRAIIFDVTGEFVDCFFNPKTDILLNPLRKGGVNWLPWNDCTTNEEYTSLAVAFVDAKSIKSDRYWEDAAMAVLVEAFKKEESTKNIEDMLRVISKVSLQEFCQYFADTNAARYVSKEAEKAAASVRSTLISKIERLKYLKNKGDFSIKDWMNQSRDNSGWLFISSTPNELDTLRPLISAWANIAIKAILDRAHSGRSSRSNNINQKVN